MVVPHEYGLDPPSKLRIGAKICCELLAKLLADLDATKVGRRAGEGLSGGGGSRQRTRRRQAAAILGCWWEEGHVSVQQW